MQVAGESNSIKYDVTPQFFDCGMQPYDRAVDKEFFINNRGKVRLLGLHGDRHTQHMYRARQACLNFNQCDIDSAWRVDRCLCSHAPCSSVQRAPLST